MWAWTWFSVSRPTPLLNTTLGVRPISIHAIHTGGRHTFKNAPNYAGPANPRDKLDSLKDNLINWCLCNDLLQHMPSVVHHDIGVWMAKGLRAMRNVFFVIRPVLTR